MRKNKSSGIMEFEKIIENLENEKCYAIDNYVPIIREKSAKFLYDFVKNNGYKNVLEIGTAIGFSGSIIIGAGAEKLTTIDINSDYLKIAKNTFVKMSFDGCVEIINGDAFVVLKDLIQKSLKFDMIFLDGAKGQYVNYLQMLTKLLSENGVIFADNVLLHGMVESKEKIPHKKRTMVVNLRKYLDVVNSEPYETELIRLEDGIAITRYKGVKNV